MIGWRTYGRRRDKTCLQGFWQSEIKTNLLSYSDKLENWNFTRSKSGYYTLQLANNIGADQTARMHRLVCAFVVLKPQKTSFLASRPIFASTWDFGTYSIYSKTCVERSLSKRPKIGLQDRVSLHAKGAFCNILSTFIMPLTVKWVEHC